MRELHQKASHWSLLIKNSATVCSFAGVLKKCFMALHLTNYYIHIQTHTEGFRHVHTLERAHSTQLEYSYSPVGIRAGVQTSTRTLYTYVPKGKYGTATTRKCAPVLLSTTRTSWMLVNNMPCRRTKCSGVRLRAP